MTIAQTFRRACSALAVTAALAAPGVVRAQVAREVANRAPVVTITPSDLDSSNAKVAMAYNDLVATWGRELQQMGARFEAPGIARYRNAIRTACGVMTPSNAAYCAGDNTIYYDELFVAGLQK